MEGFLLSSTHTKNGLLVDKQRNGRKRSNFTKVRGRIAMKEVKWLSIEEVEDENGKRWSIYEEKQMVTCLQIGVL